MTDSNSKDSSEDDPAVLNLDSLVEESENNQGESSNDNAPSDQSGNTSSEDESVDSDESEGTDVSYAVIYRAGSLTDFDKIADPESIESSVSRSRGQSDVKSVQTETDSKGVTFEVEQEEGRLKVDSNYMFRFVSDELVEKVQDPENGLSVFDILKVDSIKDYPAPENMIETLPPQVRGRLKENGYVQVQGVYESVDARFYGIQLGWHVDYDVDPWDKVMEIVAQVSSTPSAVDYTFVKYGPERWDAEEVAEARGIETRTVQGNVRAIENELDR